MVSPSSPAGPPFAPAGASAFSIWASRPRPAALPPALSSPPGWLRCPGARSGRAGQTPTLYPVTRSSNLIPSPMTTSAWSTTMLHQYIPCIPSIPRLCGWFRGKPLNPSRVLITGMPDPSSQRQQLVERPGVYDAVPRNYHRSFRLVHDAQLPCGRIGPSFRPITATPWFRRRGPWCVFELGLFQLDIPRHVDQHRPRPALPGPREKRPVIVRARSPADITRYVRFVHTAAMLQMSHSWNASVPNAARATWPVMATNGTLSALGSHEASNEVGSARA